MSQQYITEEGQNFQYTPSPSPKPKKSRKPLLFVAAGVAVLLLGFGVGNAAGSSKIPDTVEKVVEKPVDKPVPYTPAVCSEALRLSGDVISSASRALGYSNDSLNAVGDLDAERIKANGSKIEAETSVLEELGPKYQSARDECLSTVQ